MSDRMNMPPEKDLGFYQRRKHDKWREVDPPAPALEVPVADSHAHIHMLPDPAWELVRCGANGVRFVCEICDPSEDDLEVPGDIRRWADEAAALLGVSRANGLAADALPTVRIAAGVHPHNAKLYDRAVEQRLRAWLATPQTIALGEIGLDYHYDLSPRDVQRDVFRRQVRLAKELGLPIALHLRGGTDGVLWADGRDVEEDAAEIAEGNAGEGIGENVREHAGKNARENAREGIGEGVGENARVGIGEDTSPKVSGNGAQAGKGSVPSKGPVPSNAPVPSKGPVPSNALVPSKGPVPSNAHREAFEILSEEGFPERGTLLHCCALPPDELRPWVDAGCYIAYGGALTFKNAEAARAGALIVPEDRLLLETDSPYMAPEPMRGAACTPAHVIFTAERLAALRGCNSGAQRERFLQRLFDNTLRFALG